MAVLGYVTNLVTWRTSVRQRSLIETHTHTHTHTHTTKAEYEPRMYARAPTDIHWQGSVHGFQRTSIRNIDHVPTICSHACTHKQSTNNTYSRALLEFTKINFSWGHACLFFTHKCLFVNLFNDLPLCCIHNKSCVKPLVSSESTAQNWMNCIKWCHLSRFQLRLKIRLSLKMKEWKKWAQRISTACTSPHRSGYISDY